MSEVFKGGYSLGKATVGALCKDQGLLDVLSAYKKRIAGNYRPLRPDEIFTLPPGGLLVSRKIDGELWFLVSNEHGIFLINPAGRTIFGNLEVIDACVNLPHQTIVAGELYAHLGGSRERVGDLASALAKSSTASTSSISFAAFDLLQDADRLPSPIYKERHARLQELLSQTPQLAVVDVEEMQPSGVQSRFDNEVVPGASEGLIIRLPSGLIYKLKPTITIDAVIVGYTAKVDSPDLVRSVLLGLMLPGGDIQILGGCGNIGSEKDRKDLLERLSAQKVPSSVRYASDGGGLYTFVKPDVVAEIRVTDLQAEKSDGSISTNTVAIYSEAGWRSKRQGECPRPIHPVFERIRLDKSANETDIRFEQVQPYMSSQKVLSDVVELPKSTLIKREVWTKEAKGQVAIRKLLVWKSNKESIDSNFPAFVIHWTDYSPTRASPLDREVKIAPSQEVALEIANALIEENIKKGWSKV